MYFVGFADQHQRITEKIKQAGMKKWNTGSDAELIVMLTMTSAYCLTYEEEKKQENGTKNSRRRVVIRS